MKIRGSCLGRIAQGHLAPDNSPPIFKQLASRSFIRYRAKRDVKSMKPRLNAIEIILCSFIHYRTNYSSFFYPLPSLKFGGELSGANCPGGELSGIPNYTSDPVKLTRPIFPFVIPSFVPVTRHSQASEPFSCISIGDLHCHFVVLLRF